MSLPFLDKKKIAGTIMEKRSKEGNREYSTEVADEEDPDDGDYLSQCAGELLAAIERKSPSDIARAFRDMFEHCESEPHEEYDGDEDDGEDHDLFEAKG